MKRPVVLVFVQTGCGHCDEYMTRFKPLADPYYARGLPIQVGDLARNASALRLADRHKIDATPTTVVYNRAGGTLRLEGAVTDAEIRRALEFATR